ncbi:cell division protein FtsQ/DivIB [Nocardioides aurantiacus]|uniref:cell division protein FtsQ/DivIB n=1 Tax=Nocardioides aurantiacus TaxID=86796 RepID=UPI0014774AAE|nr:FtsQ-type POTRA domain-containing protein [Nocardioides aurantiacus]
MPSSTGPDEQTVRIALDDLRRRRHHQGRRRTIGRVALGLLVVALVGALAWLLLLSPYLTARGVEVAGAGVADEARVARAAEVPSGTPLARVDTDLLQRRVEAIPAVRHAEISRSWPHTLHVEVTPRTPVAVLERSGGLQALDAQGVVFGSYDARPARLPLVAPARGVGREAVVEAAGVVDALPADVARRTRTVEVGSVDEITLVLDSGRRVVWGSAEQSGTKAEVLAVMLPQLPRGVDEIDVSVPGRLTTR